MYSACSCLCLGLRSRYPGCRSMRMRSNRYYAFKLEELCLQLSVLGPAAARQVAEVCACANTVIMPSSWKSSVCSCLCLGLPQLDRLQKYVHALKQILCLQAGISSACCCLCLGLPQLDRLQKYAHELKIDIMPLKWSSCLCLGCHSWTGCRSMRMS